VTSRSARVATFAYPVSVVRFTGPLDLAAGPAVRSAILETARLQPVALLVDLSAARPSDLVVALLAALARRLLSWPGTHLVLVGGDPLAARLQAVGGAGYAQVCPSEDVARETVARVPAPHRVSRLLAPTLDAPRLARETVIETCAAWGLADPVANAQLIVSELVSNAVLHAGTDLELGLQLRDGRLYLSVRDHDRHIARRRILPEPAEHGRGLLLIDALASAWGRVPLGDGKVVWAELPAVRV
jgi:hypothetical protein